MQCGINPKGSFISSCPFMYHRLFFPLLVKVSTAIIPISQVCPNLNHKLNWNLICTYVTHCLPPPVSPVTVVQVVNFSFCNGSFSNASSHLVLTILTLGIVLSVMLLMLAVISTLKQSIMLYKATKKWQPNHYMQLFVKDGILYFLAYVFLSPSLHYPSLP